MWTAIAGCRAAVGRRPEVQGDVGQVLDFTDHARARVLPGFDELVEERGQGHDREYYAFASRNRPGRRRRAACRAATASARRSRAAGERKPAGVLVELRAQLGVGHRVLRASRGCTPRPPSNDAAVLQRDAHRALEAPGPGILRIDVIAHAPRQRRGSPDSRRLLSLIRVPCRARPTYSASASVYCRLTRPCESRRRRELLGDRLADDRHDEGRHRDSRCARSSAGDDAVLRRAAAATASMYGCITCAAGNGLNDALRLSQCRPRPSVMRSKSRWRLGSCRCDAKRAEASFEHLRRAGRARARQDTRRRCRSAPPSRGAGTSVCVPSTQHSRMPGGEAAADAGRRAPCASASQPEQLAGEIGRRRTARTVRSDEIRADETGPGATLPTRHEISLPMAIAVISVASRDGARLGQRQRRGHRRAAHVDDRLVVRVVVLERLRERAVGERRRRSRRPRRRCRGCVHGPGGDIATAASRVERPNGVSAPGQRQADDVEHAQLRRVDDIGRADRRSGRATSSARARRRSDMGVYTTILQDSRAQLDTEIAPPEP